MLQRYGVDPARPMVIFVGRITRQKGVPVLLRAAASLRPGRSWCCAPASRTPPELAAEVTGLVTGLQADRSGVIWIPEMLPKPEVIQLLSHATVFACPSLYEPLGIVNLEAMACGTAVVASRVGGIPEVVSDGETGLLVPPDDPAALAGALNAAGGRSRAGRAPWARRAVSGPRPSSAGTRSPRRPWACTPSSPADAGPAPGRYIAARCCGASQSRIGPAGTIRSGLSCGCVP